MTDQSEAAVGAMSAEIRRLIDQYDLPQHRDAVVSEVWETLRGSEGELEEPSVWLPRNVAWLDGLAQAGRCELYVTGLWAHSHRLADAGLHAEAVLSLEAGIAAAGTCPNVSLRSQLKMQAAHCWQLSESGRLREALRIAEEFIAVHHEDSEEVMRVAVAEFRQCRIGALDDAGADRSALTEARLEMVTLYADSSISELRIIAAQYRSVLIWDDLEAGRHEAARAQALAAVTLYETEEDHDALRQIGKVFVDIAEWLLSNMVGESKPAAEVATRLTRAVSAGYAREDMDADSVLATALWYLHVARAAVGDEEYAEAVFDDLVELGVVAVDALSVIADAFSRSDDRAQVAYESGARIARAAALEQIDRREEAIADLQALTARYETLGPGVPDECRAAVQFTLEELQSAD